MKENERFVKERSDFAFLLFLFFNEIILFRKLKRVEYIFFLTEYNLIILLFM